MTELIITRGLPGCGKTTRAVAWAEADRQHRARVGRDVLREHVFHTMPILDRAGEALLTEVQAGMVRTLLAGGRSVIVDDTNLPDVRMRNWADLASTAGAQFLVWDMRGVPISTCIERDAARGAAGGRLVGADIIRQIHARGSSTIPATR